MTPDQLIDKLKHSLNGPLPGAKAHSLMAPTGRIINYDLIPDKQYYRDSAVSIILYPLGDSYKCVMIKRPEYDGAHSGQMSFPGGKKDEKDRDLMETAFRETYEEVGVLLDEKHLIGSLSEVFIPVSKFKVQPFLFHLPEIPAFIPDSREVDEIFHFDFELLLTDASLGISDIHHKGNILMKEVPCFYFHERMIWGASALMLSELKMLLLDQK
jgi:8-oxo-dGTP pyrophosphatase MutT (NUDIX family)